MYGQNVFPIEWNNAQAAQLGKANGKKGCKAIRLINLLDPIGKAFYTLIWRLSPEAPCDFSYGFQPGKRREQAILIQNTVGWKLRQLKRRHFIAFHDVSNAFPSPTYAALDQTMDRHAKHGESNFLKCRYKQTQVTIECRNGSTVTVAPGTGSLQGDSTAANQFRETFDNMMAQYCKIGPRDLGRRGLSR